MFSQQMKNELLDALDEIEAQGLMKAERVLSSAQGAVIRVAGAAGGSGGGGAGGGGSGGAGAEREVLNFCANNYLGLAGNPELVEAAAETMRRRGYGLSSVRFICGTQDIHKELEARVSAFLGTEDSILYAACFDANGGVFEPLLGAEDAVISDALNHASIIDGVRLCKAARLRYEHSDMADLERCLQGAAEARYKLICTDGVFSMDGDIAKLPEICRLAEQYGALVMVDECHATGVLGATGRGTAEHFGLRDKIDIITTTFGKALGGASGGCVSGRRELVAMLRQRSRPYLFSNTLAPAVVGGTLKALEILAGSAELIAQLRRNTAYFREQMSAAGFRVPAAESAIVPVMLYDEPLALRAADMLLERGIYVIGFAYPVVPRGKARIRVQLSAAHTRAHLEQAVAAFTEVGRELGVV